MAVLNSEFTNPCAAKWDDPIRRMVQSMCQPDAYPSPVSSVTHHETHISHVFLAGDFAYKIKKPIKTDFLDYSTLQLRRHYCEEEFRLDRRYAESLYVGVVPISINPSGSLEVEGRDTPIEYAVKMHRFPDDALLSQRIEAGRLTTHEVRELANTIAQFHAMASRCRFERASRVPSLLIENIGQVIDHLAKDATATVVASLQTLRHWSDRFFAEHQSDFEARAVGGFVRECHGDLHLQNIVHFQGKLIPFDGIEFNDEFRFIDVISDMAFLAMDLAACGRLDLTRSFVNSYLERTGDYKSLSVLRWYLVYRALVRAMVAKMKADQHLSEPEAHQASMKDCHEHIDLAFRFTLVDAPSLYVTHGLSGSGKTTVSEIVVERRGAIRLRSDVERKRHFGFTVDDVLDENEKQKIYSGSASIATYSRLERLADGILRAGFPVIIDATFLKSSDRQQFRNFAKRAGVPFSILDCHTDMATLRQRIADRMGAGNDASDADLNVLDLQIKSAEPLTPEERESVVEIPDLVATIDHL